MVNLNITEIKKAIAKKETPDNGKYKTPTNANHSSMRNESGTSSWASSNSNSTNTSKNGKTVRFNSVNVFYPAAGWRGSGDGAIGNVDIDGNFWSSTGSSNSGTTPCGLYLQFTRTSFNKNYDWDKRTGMPVRCISQ